MDGRSSLSSQPVANRCVALRQVVFFPRFVTVHRAGRLTDELVDARFSSPGSFSPQRLGSMSKNSLASASVASPR